MLTLEWQTDDGRLERLSFDAAVTEDLEATAQATEHPVESGVAVVDHVRPNAETVGLEAVVTNTPVVAPGDHADGAVGQTVSRTLRVGGQSVAVNVLGFTQAFDRVRAVDAALRALREAAQLLKVYTSLRVLEDVVIERYKVTRSAESAHALFVTLELRKVRIATTARVAAPRRARRRLERGPQATAPARNESLGVAVSRGISDAIDRLLN